jgi:hypothetical protein
MKAGDPVVVTRGQALRQGASSLWTPGLDRAKDRGSIFLSLNGPVPSAFLVSGTGLLKQRQETETRRFTMTDMTPRNTSESESGLPALAGEAETSTSGDKSRRDALAVLAKHAAYTAPAVMAILSLTTNRAKAGYF